MDITTIIVNSTSNNSCWRIGNGEEDVHAYQFDFDWYDSDTYYFSVGRTSDLTHAASGDTDPMRLYEATLQVQFCAPGPECDETEVSNPEEFDPIDPSCSGILECLTSLPERILGYFQDLFIPDPDFVASEFNTLQETALGRVPFGYADAVFDIDTSQIEGMSTDLVLSMPFYRDQNTGNIASVSATINGSTDANLSLFRTFLEFVLWFSFISYIIYRVRHIV